MSDWHQQYKERYAELKKAGKSFFPYAVFKDTLVALLLLGALVFLAHHFGANLEDLADPTDTTYNPRPEWYFLALFQALKLFPGRLEAVAALGLPGILILILVLAPVLDRGPERHPLDRPIWTGLGVLVLAVLSYLTWAGLRSPMINPTVDKDAAVVEGQRLFREIKCYYCHAINGAGGSFGPDLARLGALPSDEWLIKHFQDPRSVSPTSKMPKLNLLDDEIRALIAYIRSLNVDIHFTGEAPQLFEQNCSVCHSLKGEGGQVGPDLSTIGSVRDVRYLKRYISDPTPLNPHSAMPKYKGQLTDLEIEDLAKYLASQRGETQK